MLAESLLKEVRGRSLTALAFRRDGQLSALSGGAASLTVRLAAGVLPSATAVSPAFDANLGAAATQVFQGAITIPQSPAPATRDSVGFSATEVIRITFTQPFAYLGGTLCIDISGAPVVGQTTVAWPIDLDRAPLRGSAVTFGRSCLRIAHSVPSHIAADPAMLRPGATARFLGFADPGDAAALLLAAQRFTAPMDLGFVGRPDCELWLQPDVTMFASARRSGRGPLAAMNVAFVLPYDAAFVGAVLHAQWLAIQGATFATSQALTVTLAQGLDPSFSAIVLSSPGQGAALPAVGEVEVGALPVMQIDAR